ncbi:MAG: hypothetical protein OXT69_03075 [Candidatus Poribacteria bacterium]|nr:hypothetical protein [Candidatus Poribacteria bacterium]
MKAFTAAAAAAVFMALGALTANAGQWYIGIGGGVVFGPALDMSGHNLDTTRYPDWDYTGFPDDKPEGYRWYYDLETDAGYVFPDEAAVGYMLYEEGEGGPRIEAAFSRRTQPLEQIFKDLTFLDESAIQPNNSGVVADFKTEIGDLTNDIAALNLYYDQPIADRFKAYLGVGAGVARVNISDLFFRVNYIDADGVALSEYDSSQCEDFSETAFATNILAGVDYQLTRTLLTGLKLSYAVIGEIESISDYMEHPIEDLKNTTVFSGNRQWSLAFALKYAL